MRAGLPRLALAASVAALVTIAGGCGGKAVTFSTSTQSGTTIPQKGPGLFAYDRSQPLDAVESGVVDAPTVEVEDIRFRSFDGTEIPGILARPQNASKPYRCVLFEGGIEFTPTKAFFLQNPLIASRYQVMSIESRISGPGVGNQVGALAARNDPGVLKETIRDSVIDLRRAIDYLESRADCAKGGVGYVGVSFGGILGALVSGADDRIKAPALIAAGGDWKTLLEGTDLVLPGIENSRRRFQSALRTLAPLDPVRWVPRISPRPVLMINGRSDRTVVPAAARKLHAAARQPKQVLWYAGGHDPFSGPWADRVTSTLLGFLDTNLTG